MAIHHHHLSFGSKKWLNKHFLTIMASLITLLAAIFINATAPISLTLFLISYLLAGKNVLAQAGKNILAGQIFDENFLMSIATIGAFVIGEYTEGVAVMLLFLIGEYLQDMAVNHSRDSVKSLLNIRPDYAHKKPMKA